MPPFTNIPLSPAELSYLYTSLSQSSPIRPDGRSPTQFRSLIAETDLLPSTNGSARVCFADGTEAIAGVKAEVEKSSTPHGLNGDVSHGGAPGDDIDMKDGHDEHGQYQGGAGLGRDEWVEVSIEIPGLRDDDALPVFLAAMLSEALLADRSLKDRLWINSRYHWRLYIDILLLSPPLSYPLPLLSLTTHLSLLTTRIPTLISERDEDPLFNDDWEASTYLYSHKTPSSNHNAQGSKPPVTLLVINVGDNILFDPSRDELSVADAVVALSVAAAQNGELSLVALRTIDPPSRLTSAGVPNTLNTTVSGGASTMSTFDALALREEDQGRTVWRPPRGGIKREMIARMIKMVVSKGGVGQEVMDGLANVDT